MTSNPDTLPTIDDASGPCPRCGRVSSFSTLEIFELQTRSFPGSRAVLERAGHLKCQGCDKATVVIETRDDHNSPFEAVTWWPTPGSGVLRHPALPVAVAEAHEEGTRALAVKAPHAAAAMFRSALAQVVQDKGSTDAKAKKNLKDAVKQMVADGALWKTFDDWATHIREWGNAGAHPEVFGPVTIEDAQDLEGLVSAMLDILYIQPDKLNKARPTRKP